MKWEQSNKAEVAIGQVLDAFPFPGFYRPPHDRFLEITDTLKTYKPEGARVLDFGSGVPAKAAVLARLGYECHAVDDLQDDWHLLPGMADKVLGFARDRGVEFVVSNGDGLPYEPASFDVVMLHHVLEHLHGSPRPLLEMLVGLLRDGGILFVTVPNAVNIRKRLCVPLGRTNYPDFRKFYWSPPPYRGHVREYVREDLRLLAHYLRLNVLELRGCHNYVERVPRRLRPLYRAVTGVFDGWKDTWLLVAEKPPGWAPERREAHITSKERLGLKGAAVPNQNMGKIFFVTNDLPPPLRHSL